MCDTFAGELILSFSTRDPAGAALVYDIKAQKIDDVSYVSSFRERIAKLELSLDADFPFDFHLVEVPVGSEAWKANYLQFFYKHKLLEALGSPPIDPQFADEIRRSEMQFSVTPNHVLSLAHAKKKGPTLVKASDFAFSSLHATYRGMIGMLPPPSTGAGVRIAILDSGIASDHPKPSKIRNFISPATSNVDDDHGHGTVVAMMIHDLVPDADLIVYKIADDAGRVSEWDALAALAVASADADVINLSVQFGLGDRLCATCGRESTASRSLVFESTIEHAAGTMREPLFVAAAGNAADSFLAYPARFGQVAAIGAITSTYALSDESNYGDTDHHAVSHQNHFVMPGGNPGSVSGESVGSFLSTGGAWHGTSMAAAYATAVAASRFAVSGTGSHAASTILPQMRATADTTHFAPHDAIKFGRGVAIA